MAVLRNRYHERAWFVGRYAADPDETIEVPDNTVEERAADGTLLAGLDPDDMFWERIDAPGLSRAEFDTPPPAAVESDAPAPETVTPAAPAETATPAQPAAVPDAPAPDEAHQPQ